MASIAEINLARETRVLAADTLTGDKVVNLQKEDLGTIEHLMIDLDTGRIAYPNRAFLTRLEIGEMRDSVVKSFVSETKGFIRFSLLRRPGGQHALDYIRCFACFVAVGFQFAYRRSPDPLATRRGIGCSGH